MYWRLSTILNRSNKSVWSNVFWYVEVYIFWKFIQYTMHLDKTQQILKKNLSGKINVRKNAHYFFSWAPTHHSSSFDSQFLYKLKHKVYLSKIVCGIFHSHTVLFPDLWSLTCNKKFKIQWHLRSWSSLKTDQEANFLNLENRSFE